MPTDHTPVKDALELIKKYILEGDREGNSLKLRIAWEKLQAFLNKYEGSGWEDRA